MQGDEVGGPQDCRSSKPASATEYNLASNKYASKQAQQALT